MLKLVTNGEPLVSSKEFKQSHLQSSDSDPKFNEAPFLGPILFKYFTWYFGRPKQSVELHLKVTNPNAQNRAGSERRNECTKNVQMSKTRVPKYQPA